MPTILLFENFFFYLEWLLLSTHLLQVFALMSSTCSLTLSPLFKIVAFLCPPSCPNPFYPALFFVLPKASLSSNILYNWIITMFIIFLLHMAELSSTRAFFWFVHCYDPAPRIGSGLYMALHKYVKIIEWMNMLCMLFSCAVISWYLFVTLCFYRTW